MSTREQPEITFEDLRRENVFAVLAELFPDDMTSRALLEDLDLPVARLRPFGHLSAELYWRDVCRQIARGAFTIDLGRLLGEVHARYPGNDRIAALFTGGDGERDELRVLCLAASPTDADRLRVDAEHRAIQVATRRSTRPVVPVLRPAVRRDEVNLLLLDVRPQIVHFGGHGGPDGTLVFEDQRGRAAPAAIGDLARLFAAVGTVRAVVLMSCFSGGYADQLLRAGVPAVVGASTPVDDDCATGFSRYFYEARGERMPIRRAYEMAEAALAVDRCPPHRFHLVEAAR